MTEASKQQKAKPKIDEVVDSILHEQRLKNALDLISFIKENKIALRWSSTNCWQLYYKNTRIGLIRMTEKPYPMYALAEHSWLFGPWGLDDVFDAVADNEKTKEIIWNNIRKCSNCGGSCGPGSERTLFGKSFEKTCQAGVVMQNPDRETIDCIKRMLIIKKGQLDNP